MYSVLSARFDLLSFAAFDESKIVTNSTICGKNYVPDMNLREAFHHVTY